jgi:hypothetical protein
MAKTAEQRSEAARKANATRKRNEELARGRTDGYIVSYTIPESTGVVTIYADNREEAIQKFGRYSYTKLWAGSDGDDPVIDSVLPEYEEEVTAENLTPDAWEQVKNQMFAVKA